MRDGSWLAMGGLLGFRGRPTVSARLGATSRRRRDATMPTLDVAVVEGRGDVFARAGARVRIAPIATRTTDDDDDCDFDAAMTTTDFTTRPTPTRFAGDGAARATFNEEFEGLVTARDARALARVTGLEIWVVDASGRDVARGATTLDARALADPSLDDGARRTVLGGRWCEVRAIGGEDGGGGGDGGEGVRAGDGEARGVRRRAADSRAARGDGGRDDDGGARGVRGDRRGGG